MPNSDYQSRFEAAQEALEKVVDIVATARKNPIEVPDFIRKNAGHGLLLHKQDHHGDGLSEKTLGEAKEIAVGKIALSKCVRMANWFKRNVHHMQKPCNRDHTDKGYPGTTLVAWMLWGGDADGSMKASDWAEKQVLRAEREAEKAEKAKDQ